MNFTSSPLYSGVEENSFILQPPTAKSATMAIILLNVANVEVLPIPMLPVSSFFIFVPHLKCFISSPHLKCFISSPCGILALSSDR